MKHAALAGVLLLLPALSNAQSGLDLEFATPAEFTGQAVAEAQWALVVFSPVSIADFKLNVTGETAGTNYTRIHANTHTFYSQFDHFVDLRPTGVDVADSLRATLHHEASWSSVFIEADRIRLNFTSTFQLKPSMGDNDEGHLLLPRPFDYDAVRDDGPAPPGVVLAAGTDGPPETLPFSLQADGLRRIEWHNVTTTCERSPCPDGARTTVASQPVPTGATETHQNSFIDLRTQSGALRGQGTGYLIAMGSSQMDLALNGSARFPAATLRGDCGHDACENPDGRTFLAAGEMDLAGIVQNPKEPNRLASGFSGQLSRAAIDERSVSILVKDTALGAAAVVATVVLFKIALTLFARNTKPILDHPRSKAIHDLIHSTPGLSFTDIRTRFGWGYGATHYHLQRLLKAGLIVGYDYKTSVRYFENHGRHKHDWLEHAVLQKPELRMLHEWIAEHPRSSQKQIIAAAAKWGWSRSPTQRRIQQLLEAALLHKYEFGHGVEYIALNPSWKGTDSSHSPAG